MPVFHDFSAWDQNLFEYSVDLLSLNGVEIEINEGLYIPVTPKTKGKYNKHEIRTWMFNETPKLDFQNFCEDLK